MLQTPRDHAMNFSIMSAESIMIGWMFWTVLRIAPADANLPWIAFTVGISICVSVCGLAVGVCIFFGLLNLFGSSYPLNRKTLMSGPAQIAMFAICLVQMLLESLHSAMGWGSFGLSVLFTYSFVGFMGLVWIYSILFQRE